MKKVDVKLASEKKKNFEKYLEQPLTVDVQVDIVHVDQMPDHPTTNKQLLFSVTFKNRSDL